MIGTTISHYRIVGTVGAGGMGIVYLAEDIRLNRKVALKFLPPAVAMDPHARARFMREAQSASALDHPNVAAVYEVGDWNDQLFIAMPFYPGETLRQRIARGPLSVDEAARTAAHIANGLAAAHRAGIVHRDLKPANVMLTEDGQVKILDFGLAKMFSEAHATATRMTGPGTTVGTVAYMAPEQASGGDVDQRADVWALGVILHEMLTGTLPFAGETPPAMMMAVVTAPPASLRKARPEVPEAISRLADQALEKNPARRVLTAADIARDLAAWQSGTVPTSAGLMTTARGTRVGLWIGAAVLLMAAVALAWFARDQMRTRWARETAIPEIERLNEREQYLAAFMIAREAKPVIPNDPAWTRLEPIYSRVATVQSEPSDAVVSYREYGKPDAPWFVLGNTPLERVRAPAGAFEWRIYKSTYERGDEVQSDYPNRTNVWREHVIAWAKDVRRSVDYLETRGDIDASKIAYAGLSWGAAMAPIYIAVEPRFKAAVLYVGGFYMQNSLPEVDAFNFAPRVKIPTLFLNSRFDFFYPEATSQLPMFNLFATPPADKRRVVYDTGHNIPRPELIRESVDWLDKYLGPVK